MKQVVSWTVFVLVLGASYVLAGPTEIGGPASYVVVTGHSMEPTYHDGDLVVGMKHDAYEVGDVIVYDAPTQRQFTVIHRIVKVTPDGYRTQGDNRDDPDGWTVPRDAIRGSAAVHVPHGGSAVRLLRQPLVMFVLVAGIGALSVYRRKNTTPDREPDQPSDDQQEASVTTSGESHEA